MGAGLKTVAIEPYCDAQHRSIDGESTLRNDEFVTLGGSANKNIFIEEATPQKSVREVESSFPNLLSSLNRITQEGIQSLRRSIEKITSSQAKD